MDIETRLMMKPQDAVTQAETMEAVSVIISLRQQLAAALSDKEKWESRAREMLREDSRLSVIKEQESEITQLSDNLAAALAAGEAKDAAINSALFDHSLDFSVGDSSIIDLKDAIAIKPDASALKAHDDALIERCAEVADTVRQRYSKEYDQRHDDWQGNVYWARLVGSVATVTAIRELKTR